MRIGEMRFGEMRFEEMRFEEMHFEEDISGIFNPIITDSFSRL